MAERTQFDPLYPPTGPDRVAFFEQARNQSPILVLTRKAGRVICVFQYRDVEAILLDPITWKNVPYPDGALSMLLANPPDHRHLRGVVNSAFAARAIDDLTSRIDVISSSLVDQAVERREIDLISDLGWRLPEQVMMELLGLPQSDQSKFSRWTSEMAAQSQSFLLLSDQQMEKGFSESLGSVMSEMRDYLIPLIDDRRATPTDDLLSHVVQAHGAGTLNENEALNLVILLVVAGQDAVSLLIANTIVSLLSHPEEERTLREEPGLLAAAIEEVLRFAPPFRWTAVRHATQPVCLHDIDIQPGDLAILWLESANLDERVFERPEAFDISRAYNPHIAFGAGIHFCLGAYLARLEGRSAIRMLLQRTRRIEISSPATAHPNAQFNGPSHLPLRLDPA